MERVRHWFGIAGVLLSAHAGAEESSSPFKFSGFIKADYTLSSAAVGTFGRANQVAPTEAGAQSVLTDGVARNQWNIGQSRFGLDFTPADWAKLRTEIDFVDFDQASATTSIRPRLRVMQAVIQLHPQHRLEIGQDWDIFAPPKPFTYNYVGLFFRAGNLGFMRPQLRWVGDWGLLETTVSVGLPAINTSASDSSVERGLIPYSGIKVTAKPMADLHISVTGVGSARRLEDGSGNAQNFPVYGASFSGFWKPIAPWELRFNAFWGRNLNSSGAALTLAQASFAQEQTEWGGFVSTRVAFLEHHAVHATLGTDRMFGGESAAVGTLIENLAIRAGYAFLWGNHLEAYGEWTHFKSGYSLSSGVNRFDTDGFEAGVILRI